MPADETFQPTEHSDEVPNFLRSRSLEDNREERLLILCVSIIRQKLNAEAINLAQLLLQRYVIVTHPAADTYVINDIQLSHDTVASVLFIGAFLMLRGFQTGALCSSFSTNIEKVMYQNMIPLWLPEKCRD